VVPALLVFPAVAVVRVVVLVGVEFVFAVGVVVFLAMCLLRRASVPVNRLRAETLRSILCPGGRRPRPIRKAGVLHEVTRCVSLTLNRVDILRDAQLTAPPLPAPIGLRHSGRRLEFANIFVRE
jgi:hypothetical protein